MHKTSASLQAKQDRGSWIYYRNTEPSVFSKLTSVDVVDYDLTFDPPRIQQVSSNLDVQDIEHEPGKLIFLGTPDEQPTFSLDVAWPSALLSYNGYHVGIMVEINCQTNTTALFREFGWEVVLDVSELVDSATIQLLDVYGLNMFKTMRSFVRGILKGSSGKMRVAIRTSLDASKLFSQSALETSVNVLLIISGMTLLPGLRRFEANESGFGGASAGACTQQSEPVEWVLL